jgi:nitrogen fixation protein NifX
MIKVAIASLDGVHINEHFGWCKNFYLYEVSESGHKKIEEINTHREVEDEVDRLIYKISSIEDADILYVLQIGPKASTMVQKAGIYPIKSTNENMKIDSALNSLQNMTKDNPPLWLKRIILKKS